MMKPGRIVRVLMRPDASKPLRSARQIEYGVFHGHVAGERKRRSKVTLSASENTAHTDAMITM